MIYDLRIEQEMKKILEMLRERGWYIGVMESCTGGAVANLITNIPGSSDVFKEGKVTYSDEAKIKAGVDKKIIEKYGVYSIMVAEEMAKKIEGDVGIGITGNFNFPREVFIAIRVKDNIVSEKIVFFAKATEDLKSKIKARKEMKREVVKRVLKNIIKVL